MAVITCREGKVQMQAPGTLSSPRRTTIPVIVPRRSLAHRSKGLSFRLVASSQSPGNPTGLDPEHQGRADAERDEKSDSQSYQSSSPETAATSPLDSGNKSFVAGGAVGLGVALFLGARFSMGAPSFATVEANSVPLEAALSNGRPTVLEFYANYCEVCRELLPQVYEAEETYHDKVNFVMLNVENSKWAPELVDYKVKGIPHFVFLDESGEPQAAAVGKLPREVLQGNVDALAKGQQLPYAKVAGATSPLQRSGDGVRKQTQPRDHA